MFQDDKSDDAEESKHESALGWWERTPRSKIRMALGAGEGQSGTEYKVSEREEGKEVTAPEVNGRSTTLVRMFTLFVFGPKGLDAG
ncbi:hypothetical protein J6590_027005 [Homalodisca vitripennis]|nr:hypothetical protein J6590_027005 [Homalodisca vitripennis]